MSSEQEKRKKGKEKKSETLIRLPDPDFSNRIVRLQEHEGKQEREVDFERLKKNLEKEKERIEKEMKRLEHEQKEKERLEKEKREREKREKEEREQREREQREREQREREQREKETERRPISGKEIREIILESSRKYGSKCFCCMKPLLSTTIRGGHIIPACHGGLDTSENLRAICDSCNKAHGGQKTCHMYEYMVHHKVAGVEHIQAGERMFFEDLIRRTENANWYLDWMRQHRHVTEEQEKTWRTGLKEIRPIETRLQTIHEVTIAYYNLIIRHRREKI